METAIKEQFGELGITLDDDAVIGQCADLCHRFGLEPLDLAVKWNAFFMSKQLGDKPTQSALEQLAQDMSKTMSQKVTPQRPTVHYDKSTIGSGLANALVSSFGLSGDVAEAIKTSAQKPKQSSRKRMSFASPQAVKRSVGGARSTPNTPGTPTSQQASSLPAESPRASANYATRTNAGHVELTFNPGQRPVEVASDGPRQNVHVSVFPSTLEKTYRFMFEKLHDRAEVLDVRIEDMAELIIRKHKLQSIALKKSEEDEGGDEEQQELTPRQVLEQLNSVDFPSQSPVLVVGRVCVDAAEGRLNSRSVVLEGCLANSLGKRVPLDLSSTQLFSLFPGQIIAAEGVNPTGDAFTPSLIYQGAPAPRKKTKPQEFLDLYFSNDGPDGGAVNVMMAAGPFTTNQDLTYAPLDDFLAKVSQTRPEVVIVIGPFVHDQHPLITGCEFDESFDEVLTFVMEKITGVVSSLPHTHAIVIPSLGDVTHDFIFPQAPFQIPTLRHDVRRVHFLANPSTFMINELTFAVTSNDVLFQLSRSGTASNMHTDRMQRLVNHLFEQRSFYPLDPPHEQVHLDYAHIDNLKLPVTPDVIILPSTLRHFVRDVNGSLAINPGHLTRMSAGGTYAHLLIHGPRRNDIPEKSKGLLSGIVDRSACRIIRV
ncbi:hypothetical protein PTSG_02360 [Salpingoeca rosetta]|uniref:DNA polymerase alpha subunit B n=1 Tax=Salpingoeca rosetta (strain ATCC 50818 / BSB-021) TaxID=946362 RepID=F2U1Z2_SALR5|nr:uncharacterized protein PTSG_02360 [Salpingoeca rosetta]EGD81644.1 hypothetical protein PTSG_02360 [Salpingoeca rosetta]|eukprot:XP_004996848.1 hypothetical protein PTSG_02360 [Salpingoeca rosetta]